MTKKHQQNAQSMSSEAESIIRSVFAAQLNRINPDYFNIDMRPTYEDLVEFAEILAEEPKEEKIQEFLDLQPKIIFSSLGHSECTILAFLTKPPIGTRYFADFAIVGITQGGPYITLVELERSHVDIFTKTTSQPAETLRSAIGQVSDWEEYISINKSTFFRDLLERVETAPLFTDRKGRGDFRMMSKEDVKSYWQEYGDSEYAYIGYKIVLGRWGKLSDKHKRKLTKLNQSGAFYSVSTYDQMMRAAFDNPFLGHW